MNRRELLRAGVLASAAAALPRTPPLAQNTAPSPELTPAQSGVDASKDLAAPGWKPLFLDAHQNETLIVLSDLILPATDTPGAKRSEEHTSELQSHLNLVCRLLLEKKKQYINTTT